MKKCPWAKCWWGAITPPGYCAKGGDMEDKNCSLFLNEEEKLKEWERRSKSQKYMRNKNG